MAADPRSLAGEEFCYLTITGRVTGRPHEIEIWFAVEDHTLYMLSGARDCSDPKRTSTAARRLRIGGEHFGGRVRIIEDAKEHALARRLLVDKY